MEIIKISKVRLAYFTPIMLTRTLVYNIAFGVGKGLPNEQYNLTSVKERERLHTLAEDELLIAALPTFGGRAPVMEPPLFRNLRGSNTPAVVMVTYGARGYDDTLLETQAILHEQGFVVFAGAAFITRHALSPLVGQGRPNMQDTQTARAFAQQVLETLEGAEQMEAYTGFPGNTPYKPLPPPSGLTPTTNEKCVLCMQCFRWCPVDAIPYNDPNHTVAGRCILCHGCIVRCPVKARTVEDEGFRQRVAQLEETCAGLAPEPELFI
ncbi:MAG: hypothetical protein GXY32_04890 [Ruminococcaceae bacterium]|nr:hypothetical protein [Oscillospiraceae bacterium]